MIPWIVLAILIVLALAAMFTLLRGFLQAVRYRRREPYVPVPEVFPPVPILKQPSIYPVGIAAVVWGAAHMVLAVVWLGTRVYVTPTISSGIVVLYATVGAALAGLGGMMFLTRQPFGRKLIAWGAMLGGLLSFLGCAVSIFLPRYYEAPQHLKDNAGWISGLFLVYMAAAVALGWLAQTVARPAEEQTGPAMPR
jgi:hypothetical protein